MSRDGLHGLALGDRMTSRVGARGIPAPGIRRRPRIARFLPTSPQRRRSDRVAMRSGEAGSLRGSGPALDTATAGGGSGVISSSGRSLSGARSCWGGCEGRSDVPSGENPTRRLAARRARPATAPSAGCGDRGLPTDWHPCCATAAPSSRAATASVDAGEVRRLSDRRGRLPGPRDSSRRLAPGSPMLRASRPGRYDRGNRWWRETRRDLAGAVGPSAGGPVAVGLAVVPAGTANATFWRSIGADVLTPGLDASNAAVIAPLAGAWAIACSMDQICGVSSTTSSRRPSIFCRAPVRKPRAGNRESSGRP